jgi:hypothetical protein
VHDAFVFIAWRCADEVHSGTQRCLYSEKNVFTSGGVWYAVVLESSLQKPWGSSVVVVELRGW